MPGGQPHVMPVWFVLDGEELVFTTGADSVKGRNLPFQVSCWSGSKPTGSSPRPTLPGTETRPPRVVAPLGCHPADSHTGTASSERHRYRHARVRYGIHGLAIFSSLFGSGSFLRR